MIECPPCGKRTAVDFRNGNLFFRSRELADGFLPEIALSIPVIERYVPDRCPAVGES